MSNDVLFAFNIVKGEAGGDKYLEDVEFFDPETETLRRGAWKSEIERLEKTANIATEVEEHTIYDNTAISVPV